MSESSLTRLTYIEEQAWGVTPGSPQMQSLRYVSETLSRTVDTITSPEITDTRQTLDLTQTLRRAAGELQIALSYGTYDDFISAALFKAWTAMPVRANAGVADSVITDVADATDTFTVVSGGDSFKAGHLIYTTGFTNAANNGIFRVGSSTTTTIVVAGTPTLTNESAPPGTAKIQVVGFQGASGDITATAGGLASTVLDFTTLGLAVGQWLKIGGTATADKFATAALNGRARISAISANALTLDHKPTGWTTDAGTGKTIKVWVGDYCRVGTASSNNRRSFTVEKGFLGQAVPNYLIYTGMMVDRLSLDFALGELLRGSLAFLGEDLAVPTTTSLDSTPTSVGSEQLLNAIDNVSLLAEGGAIVTSPNYVTNWTVELTNNLRHNFAIGQNSAVRVGLGQANISGQLETYFGDAAIYSKFINDTNTSIAAWVEKNGQGYVFYAPKVKLTAPSPQVGGNNRDVMLTATWTALYDTALGTSFQVDRFAYFE